VAKKKDEDQQAQPAGGKPFPPTPYQPGDLEIRWQRATGDSRQADPQE
jgi:hypothetical protein